MKVFVTFFTILLSWSSLIAQPPVAVNDTATGQLGAYLTIHVTENDYSPEGLSFKILIAPNAYSFTDSTITYFFNYDEFYNMNQDYWYDSYVLQDENGQTGEESLGRVAIILNNQFYYDTLDINNIKTTIYADNIQFWNPSDDRSFYEYPKGSGKNTIFNQSLWIGGKNGSGQLKLAADRYRQTGIDFWGGPVSVDGDELSVDSATALLWHQVWKLNVEEVTYHKLHYNDPGYEPIENIKNWPAHGDVSLNQSEFLAPFIDVDGDGLYDPYAGDYPLIRGDQCIFFIFNDCREHTETEGETIGLEIHGMVYEFYETGSQPMANTVFLSYKIFNRSFNNLNDTYIGLFCDFDIGFAYDDYVGCDVTRGAFYGYNGDDIDGSGQPENYGENPPAQGIVILGGPFMDENGMDDPDGGCDESITGVGFGDGVVDNERLGMTKFVYFSNSSGVQGDPQFAPDYYQYLNSTWKDGTAMEYGGNGHISSGSYGPACNFMFPGLSDPCFWGTGGVEPFGPINWTEEIAGNLPFDRRGLSIMGPFTFKPNTMQKVDLAFVTARGTEGPYSSVDLLKEYIDLVKEEYYQDSDYFGYQWLGTEEKNIVKNEIQIFPNPVSTDIWFELDILNKNTEFAIYDTYGRLIKTGQLSSSHRHHISLAELERGMYVMTISTETKIYTSKIIKN